MVSRPKRKEERREGRRERWEEEGKDRKKERGKERRTSYHAVLDAAMLKTKTQEIEMGPSKGKID